MYGTVAKMRVKPGSEQKLTEMMNEYKSLNVPGYLGAYIYRMDRDSNEYILAVAFQDKETYVANANSTAQNERYQKMRELLESDPDWNDGEIVSHTP